MKAMKAMKPVQPPLWTLALFLLSPAAAAQEPAQPAPDPREARQETAEVERLAAWPEVDRAQRDGLLKDVERLRKGATPEMARQAREALVARGAVAAPFLLDKLGKERDAAARARMCDVLEQITGAEHTRLFAQRFGDGSEHVRAFALRRAAAFPDPGTREPALAAWRRASEAAAKARTRDDEEEGSAAEDERFAAALATTASGSLEALADLCTAAEERWRKDAAAIRAAAAGARGPSATEAVRGLLAGAADARVIACLRVLAACGEPEAAPRLVAPYLDAESNQVRVAAINALRGIVDGAPPHEQISAFDAIEEAKRWKARL